MVRKFLSSMWAGALAMFLAKALGVPLWRDWDIGDQADFFIAASACVWFGIGALSPAAVMSTSPGVHPSLPDPAFSASSGTDTVGAEGQKS